MFQMQDLHFPLNSQAETDLQLRIPFLEIPFPSYKLRASIFAFVHLEIPALRLQTILHRS